MKAKMTPWFSCDVKPARPGYYDALYNGDVKCDRRRYFNGKCWTHGPEFTSKLGFGRKGGGDHWRGLANPSKDSG